jgi:coenzyme F420-dependent glucose-6-phosphate dehydrogenase
MAMTNVQFGWKAGAEQYPPSELLDYAVAAEQAGFDLVEVSDHFLPWDPSGQACFAWTWLGAVAAKTTRVRLGTGVTCPILRYEPPIVAQAVATLDAMAPGRAYLGVGTGEALNEYPVTGLWPEYEARREMLAEAIDIMRRLWTGAEVSFSGEYFETHRAKLYTLPASMPPIYVSSMVPESAEFAGRYGDGLITTGGEPHDLYEQLLRNFEDAARDYGREPRSPRLVEIQVAVTDDEQSVIEAMKQYWSGAAVPALFNHKIYSPEESARNGKVVGAETFKQKMCISADPRQHVLFAQKYLDMGFDQLIFHCPGPDQRAFIETYGREVLPALRERMRAAA